MRKSALGQTVGTLHRQPSLLRADMSRLKSKKFEDHISQAQLFWTSHSPPEKMHLISALGSELDHCDDPVVYNRMTERLCDIDLELAQAVAEKVGAPTPTKQGKASKGQKSAGLSFTAYNAPEPTIVSRRVVILVGDGYDPVAFDGVYAVLKAAKAFPFVIGPKRQPVLEARSKGRTFLVNNILTLYDVREQKIMSRVTFVKNKTKIRHFCRWQRRSARSSF